MKETFGITFILVMFATAIACLVGWVMNIFTIISMLDGGFTAELAFRIVGIPIPIIGAVMGYL